MKVLIPRPGCWFIHDRDDMPLNGPFHDSGEPWQSINFSTADLSTFRQGSKIASENSVFHQKVDGNIYIVPQLSKLKPIGKDLYGLDLFNVKGYYRSGHRKSPVSIPTSLQLPLTGQCSMYSDAPTTTNVYATHVALVDPWQVQYCWASNTRGAVRSWSGYSYGIRIMHVEADDVKVSNLTNRYDADGPKDSSELAGRAYTRRYANEKILATSSSTRWCRKFFLEDVGFSMSAVKSWINTLINPYLFQNLPSLNNTSWGDLIHEATGNLDANSANMIAFFRDLKDIKSLIPKLKELGRITTHANNYLAMEYGVLPTISDLKAIWEAFSPKEFYDRSGYRRVSAYEIITDSSTLLSQPVQVTHTRRIHVAVNNRDTGLDALSERIRSMGFFPSLTNIWDLVPYSFVIDWFVDVGSVFERIDTRHRLFNLDIPYVIKSDKVEVLMNSINPELGTGLDLVVSRYSRDVTTDVPQPRIFGEISKPPTVQNHWIEGSALILQRTKKNKLWGLKSQGGHLYDKKHLMGPY